jgi:polyhydroxyalkanoate synthesis regulator phasin
MKTAALFACLMFTAGVLSSCEREPSIPEKITAIYSALNELDQDIKRLGSRTDTLESKTEMLEKRVGDLENKTERLGSNTDTSSVTYLEGRLGALEKRMHDLERWTQR